MEARAVDYLGPTQCSLEFSPGAPPAVTINGDRLSASPVIWDRSKFFPNTAYYFDDVLEGESDVQARRRHQLQEVEWRATYQLLMDMPGVSFLNHPGRRRDMLKPVQQRVAEALGLPTPPSLVSNDYEAIKAFFDKYPDAVLKSLSGGRFARSEEPASRTDMLMTMRVTADDIGAAAPESFRPAPHFFQKRIEKAYEVRLFAHRGGSYSFSVDSQKAKFTSTDWRHGASLLEWEPCEAPPQVESAVKSFLMHFDLFYGSFDFVVTESREWVFLECNQDGQWTWLDRLVGHALSKGLAEAIFEKWFN